MKTFYTMDMAYEDAAETFRLKGDLRPSHCDVRCHINNSLEYASREGYRVHHGYNQDKAHGEVLKLLRK